MTDGYISDKEQIESMKKWWSEQGKYIAIAVVIGLLIGFGWRYWHQMQVRRTENASAIYQSVVQADNAKQSVTVVGGAKILMKDFANTPYASLAAMIWAKEAVLVKKYDLALSKLQWVIAHGKVDRLKEIAHISAARILLEQGKTKQALAQLKSVNTKSFAPLVDWVKGDLYRQEGDAKLSRKYYQEAKNALAAVPPAAALMNMNLAQPVAPK